MRSGIYTLMIHREGELQSRQIRISAWVARLLMGIAIALVTVGILAVVFYGPTARAAARAPFLEREVDRLKTENGRVVELARRLDEVESRYAQLRAMLGAGVTLPGTTPAAGDSRPGDDRLYVAPPMIAGAPSAMDSAAPPGPSIPSRWPLSVPSYRTRGLAEGDPRTEAHGGIDLAVPAGSEVRASGGGQITETGTDSAYGLYIRINHGSGYESMYGHLSRAVVTRGDQVRAGQVIGLSGSSGRSTAPHLHFEILRRGRSVDPLSLVKEGS
jgi:murein DD-endopeptidase MepM/ murein hydrolase activator NlpD